MAPSRRPTLKKCCLIYPWCVFLFLLLLAFIAFISVLFWTSWRPMKPTYTINVFSLPALNDLQKSQQTNSTILFGIQVLNPNRAFSIRFKYINITLCYGDEPIGKTVIDQIAQLKPTQINSSLKLVSANQPFWQHVRGLIKEGKVEVKVRLETQFKYKFLSISYNNDREILDGRVPVGNDGEIVGDKKVNLTPPNASWITKVHSFIWILLLLHLF